MNTDFTSHFAKQLTTNPALFDEARERLLAEHITLYVDGTLPPDDATEVAALIEANPRAKTIHANILAARAFLASDDGNAWLKTPITSSAPTPSRRNTSESSIRDSATRFLQRVRSAIRLGDPPAPAGMAFAHGDGIKEFDHHLENQVVSRIWKDESRGWLLWLVTENADFTQLSYQFGTAAPCHAPLVQQNGGSYLFEAELNTEHSPASHPVVMLDAP